MQNYYPQKEMKIIKSKNGNIAYTIITSQFVIDNKIIVKAQLSYGGACFEKEISPETQALSDRMTCFIPTYFPIDDHIEAANLLMAKRGLPPREPGIWHLGQTTSGYIFMLCSVDNMI